MDPDLAWNHHVKGVKEKGLKSVQALQALAGSTWGFSREQMLSIYNMVVVPQMTYACSVWYLTEDTWGLKRAQTKALAALTAVQKEALRVATGAFRTVAGGVLEAETYTVPNKQKLERLCVNTAMRIRGTPLFHRIKTERGQIRDQDWRERRVAPLHKMEVTVAKTLGQLALHQVESHLPVVAPPWWKPPSIQISAKAEDAVKEHDQVCRRTCANDLIVYTDGSAIDGGVGGAAVVMNMTQVIQSQSVHLGREDQATAYVAELAGIQMALEMACARLLHGRKPHTCHIFTDNQAAIRASYRPGGQSGQWILRKIVTWINQLTAKGTRVVIHWIPAHIGVPGNEAADVLAKEAAKNDPARTYGAQRTWNPPQIYHQASRRRTAWGAGIEQCKEEWAKAPSGVDYRKKYGGLDKKHSLFYRGVENKALSGILIQLRTGKIGLHHYLHKIQKADSPECECGQGYQTVSHVIEECPLFQIQRKKELGRSVVPEAYQLLTDPRAAHKVAQFVLRTGLLGQFRAARNRFSAPMQ